MACDLQFSHTGGIVFKGTTKIIQLKLKVSRELFGTDKAFIGFAGNADAWGEVVSWLTIPDGKPPRCKGMEFLMLTKENKFYHGTNMTNWMYLDEPSFSIGSGMHLAMAAMTAGKTPKEAILIASKHDPMTGMGAKEYHLE